MSEKSKSQQRRNNCQFRHNFGKIFKKSANCQKNSSPGIGKNQVKKVSDSRDSV